MSHFVERAIASPLVGEVGGGQPASAGHEILCAPPPNPPHKGEGFFACRGTKLPISDDEEPGR
jgi:hypothetical protein